MNAAVENGTIKANPALGIKPMKVPSDEFKPWTEELIDRYQAHWTIGTKQRLAFDR